MSGVKRRMVFGVGYDSKGKYKSSDGSKPTKIYSVWRDMIERCYNPKKLIRRPNYVGCSVDERWHDFQEFALWYDNHEYSDMGYELDKDILFAGNRVYSPETVCLVPRDINMLFTSAKRARGLQPQGVIFYKPTGKYRANLRVANKPVYLGYHDTPEQAFEVYKKAKEDNVKRVADLWFGNIEPKVYEALMDWELESI